MPRAFNDFEYASSEIGGPDVSYPGLQAVCDSDRLETLWSCLGSNWEVSDIRNAMHQLCIDLRQEPGYSRMIFDRLVRSTNRKRDIIKKAAAFLSDPNLNIRGAGNYLAAVEYLVRSGGLNVSSRSRALLDVVYRALQLGLIPREEIGLIIRALPGTDVREEVSKEHIENVATCYRAMWDKIGECTVLSHVDLGKELVDMWLHRLTTVIPNLDLARDIIAATQSMDSEKCALFSTLIIERLRFPDGLDSDALAAYVDDHLRPFNSDVASTMIIRVTESLISSSGGSRERSALINRWRECLGRLVDVPSIVLSRAWVDTASLDTQETILRFDGTEERGIPISQRVLIRLWILKTFSALLPESSNWNPRATNCHVFNLLYIYRSIIQSGTDGRFLDALMHGIRGLDAPPSGLLATAAHLIKRTKPPPMRTLTEEMHEMHVRRQELGRESREKAFKTHWIRKDQIEPKKGWFKKYMSRKAMETFDQLESPNTPLGTIFADIHAFNSTKEYIYYSFEQLIRQVDITSPFFLRRCIRLAETGDISSIWTTIRILRAHTPLKIALAKSWHPPPSPSQLALVRYHHPPSRSSDSPDPRAALETIHVLAVAFSRAENVHPRRAFGLVAWLYGFLVQHQAPVEPVLVRALYFAGVTRYQRIGKSVAPGRFNYIMDVVRRFETSEVVESF